MAHVPIEHLLVNQAELDELRCFVCLQLLELPHQCVKGHLVCKGCILPSKRSDSHFICSECSQLSPLSKNLVVQKHIENLKVYCWNRFQDKEGQISETETHGCQLILCYKDLWAHSKNCDFQVIACPYRNCKKQIPLKQLENHKATCSFQTAKCPQCGKDYLISNKEQHVKICENEPVYCSLNFKNCAAQVPRKDYDDHLKQNAVSHLLMLKQDFEEQLASSLSLSDQKKNAYEEQKEIRISWKIDNLEVVRSRQLKSRKFFTHGFGWYFVLQLSSNETVKLIVKTDKKSLNGREITLSMSLWMQPEKRNPEPISKDDYEMTFNATRTNFPVAVDKLNFLESRFTFGQPITILAYFRIRSVTSCIQDIEISRRFAEDQTKKTSSLFESWVNYQSTKVPTVRWRKDCLPGKESQKLAASPKPAVQALPPPSPPPQLVEAEEWSIPVHYILRP